MLKVNTLPDIIIITLVGMVTIASIVLASSYKRLWKGTLKSVNTIGLIESAQPFTPPTPNEETQTKETSVCSEPTAAPIVEEQNKPLEQITNIESHTTPVVEAPQPITTIESRNESQLQPPTPAEPSIGSPTEAAPQPPASIEPPKDTATKTTSRTSRRRRSTTTTRAKRRSKKAAEAKQNTETQPTS